MGFAQALSGLNGASKALEAIGNNISNSATVGFKSSSVQFADVFATSLTGGGSNQVGIGVGVSKVAQQFAQGNISTSGNPLDMAINGGGMFRLNTNGSITYTRTGQFLLDKNGFIVNSGGKQLTGFAADPVSGVIVPGSYVPLQMNNAPIPPVATLLSQIQSNLDSRALPPSSMTPGETIGSAMPGSTLLAPFPLSISSVPTAAGLLPNDQFDISVDGLPAVTVTIPTKSYTTVGDLATAMETAINAKLSGSSAAVDVTATTAGQLKVASRSVGTAGSQGNGSTVVLTPTLVQPVPAPPGVPAVANTGFEVLFAGLPALTAGASSATAYTPAVAGVSAAVYGAGITAPTVSAGVDNFSSTDTNSFTASTAQTVYDSLGNPHTLSLYFVKTAQQGNWQMYSTLDNIAAPSPGSVTGSAVLPTTTTVAAPDNTFDLNVDGGGLRTITIPPLAYTPSTLVAAINLALQTATDPAGVLPAPIVVPATASLDPFGKLVISTNAVNVPHTLAVTADAAVAGSLTVLNLFGSSPTPAPGAPAKMDYLKFNTDGSLINTASISESFALTTGAVSPLLFSVDLKGSTQYGIGFGVNQLLQDGYTSGRISGLSISADGVVQGNYSNGKSRNLGQIVLASFINANGLQSLGGNQWAETSDSGQPVPGTPGSGTLGRVQSGAIEESNVDLTAELVQMITQQRSYQANAQTIKTIDQVLQTLVNLR